MAQIDTFLQEYVPTSHLIIEPHPDVLAFARRNGWYDRPGVRFYEGTWKEFFRDLEQGKEEYLGWDAIYFGAFAGVPPRRSDFLSFPLDTDCCVWGLPCRHVL